MNSNKYDQAFIDTFGIQDTAELVGYKFRESPNWDSVGHMMLCAALEDAFGIQLDGEDILTLTDYESGKKIVEKYGIML